MTEKRNRRDFIKIGAAVAGGAVVASTVEIPLLTSQSQQKDQQISQVQSQLDNANQQLSNSQAQIGTQTGFITLNKTEQSLVESVAETIIPSDSNGPGAKEAGVIYFIDRQLAGDYGKSGNMFMQGPFVSSGQTGPITVNNITYSQGSPSVRVGAGTRYQYSLNMREFWRASLEALQSYANSAYGNNFENLNASQKTQVLQDLWANKPVNFSDITPQDFAYELFFMVWSGFLMDPLYGGNIGMVGWTYLGFNGTNLGNSYGEGHTPQQLMVDSKPTRLKPASMAQFQAKGMLVPM